MENVTVDVVVVGGASAGYAAAVSASMAGAERVLVLEKGDEATFGGNCRFSIMGFRFAHAGTSEISALLPESLRSSRLHVDPYPVEQFTNDLNEVTRGRIDQDLARTLAEDSHDAIEWMTELGHTWEFFHGGVDDGEKIRYHPGTTLAPTSGGLGLVQRWRKIGDEQGIELRFNSRVTGLLGDSQQVRGVIVSSPDGNYEVHASAVIIASGGFQASAEMRARYLGKNADLMKVRGSRHNTGEVLAAAVALGAATSGHWSGAHASPVTFDAPAVEMDNAVNRYAYPYGISVNSDAQRFFDESERHRTYTYAKTGWAVLGERDGVAYQIYDQRAVERFPSAYANAPVVSADTIEELAKRVGLDSAALAATVASYNAAIREDIAYDPTKEDGRGTEGITPKHTNWALSISEPPFLAYKVTGAVTFSFGGLRIDTNAQVINTTGAPIKGLYANGDVCGIFYHNYPSSSGMTRNVVFGGRAGAHAATAR